MILFLQIMAVACIGLVGAALVAALLLVVSSLRTTPSLSARRSITNPVSSPRNTADFTA